MEKTNFEKQTISENLLSAYGAESVSFAINQIIFEEGMHARFYYQIITGIVELNNHHDNGKQFTQSILSDGQSFGESALFNDKTYLMNAITTSACTILKLPKADFLNLLHENKEASLNLSRCLADRLYYKNIMLFHLSSSRAYNKIIAVLDFLKNDDGSARYSYHVALTRQQLANLTGLRIETVIRTLKKMEAEKIVIIKHGKLFY